MRSSGSFLANNEPRFIGAHGLDLQRTFAVKLKPHSERWPYWFVPIGTIHQMTQSSAALLSESSTFGSPHGLQESESVHGGTLAPLGVNGKNVVTFLGLPSSNGSRCNLSMDIQDVRRRNLGAIIEYRFEGNVSALARAVDKVPSQILDVLSSRKAFGERLARKLEGLLQIPQMTLDNINVYVSEDGSKIAVEGGQNTVTGPDVKGKAPLISWVSAGRYCSTVDLNEPGIAEDWIDTTVPVKKHTYALRVVGDSMEPLFPEGTIIIVEPELEATPGDYVIARNDQHEATFKQLIKDGPDWFLSPLNPRYPLKPFTDKDEICGVIRSAERRFR